MATYLSALVYAGVVLGLLLVGMAVLESRRWVRPHGGGELPDLPPAVVNLLVHRFRVDADAVAATVVDLARRDLLDLEYVGPGFTLVRLHRSRLERTDGLAFERSVVEVLDDLAVEDLVPTQACTLGPDDLARSWQTEFVSAVVDDAERRGLLSTQRSQDLRRLARLPMLALLGFCATPLVVLLSLHHQRVTTVAPGTDWWGLLTFVTAVAPLGVVVAYVCARRRSFPSPMGWLVPSRDGRAAAARWRAERERLAAANLAAHGPAGELSPR